MDFLEFCMELEAHFLGAGEKLMGLQLLQLELRLGKNPSRNLDIFSHVTRLDYLIELPVRPWGGLEARMGLNMPLDICLLSTNSMRPIMGLRIHMYLQIGERRLPIESTIASRSTDVMVEPQ
ncbi:hypothetical protein Tco_1173442 [Tanacetum coccineum]